MTTGKEPIIFIRLTENDKHIKKKLEELAWSNRKSLNTFLKELLLVIAQHDTCDTCPIGVLRDAYQYEIEEEEEPKKERRRRSKRK